LQKNSTIRAVKYSVEICLSLLFLMQAAGCRFNSSRSKSKSDESANLKQKTVPKGPLKSLSGAFGVSYKTVSGSTFPIHFDFEIALDEAQTTATFNSQVVSDGGLEKAFPTAKAKPDVSLKMTVDSSKDLSLTYTSDTKKVLNLKARETEIGWQIVSLNYFGTEAQVEGSWVKELWVK
jgi:hypothetical protein